MDQFRQWGIFDAVAEVSSASDYFEILTATGEPIIKDEWPGMEDYPVKTHTHLIHRGDFIDALVGVLPPGHGQARPQARARRATGASARPRRSPTAPRSRPTS